MSSRDKHKRWAEKSAHLFVKDQVNDFDRRLNETLTLADKVAVANRLIDRTRSTSLGQIQKHLSPDTLWNLYTEAEEIQKTYRNLKIATKYPRAWQFSVEADAHLDFADKYRKRIHAHQRATRIFSAHYQAEKALLGPIIADGKAQRAALKGLLNDLNEDERFVLEKPICPADENHAGWLDEKRRYERGQEYEWYFHIKSKEVCFGLLALEDIRRFLIRWKLIADAGEDETEEDREWRQRIFNPIPLL